MPFFYFALFVGALLAALFAIYRHWAPSAKHRREARRAQERRVAVALRHLYENEIK